MPLFQCQKCGCVENTACSGYWWTVHKEKKPPVCSECEDGVWHGMFDKEDAVAGGYMVGEDGFLYGPSENPTHTRIIGPAPSLPTS